MKLFRIQIYSWTASFRYPNIISGYQPTLDVPPISTVLGLINAAAGNYLKHAELKLAYYFDYEAKCSDLETIYQVALNNKGIPKNDPKSNVIQREFLYNCRLFLYTDDPAVVGYFRMPVFQMLLGRSGDLACIVKIEEVELASVQHAKHIRGQIVPFDRYFLPGLIQPLPIYFTNEIPRKNIGTAAYSVIPWSSKSFLTDIDAYRDEMDGNPVDLYFHNLRFE